MVKITVMQDGGEKATGKNQKEEYWRKVSRFLLLVEYRDAKLAESYQTRTKTKKAEFVAAVKEKLLPNS